MIRDLALLGVAIAAGVAVHTICRAPSMLFMSMNRGALWRIRDVAFDERALGRIPDTRDTQRFIHEVEQFIIGLPLLTPASLKLLSRGLAPIRPGESRIEILRPRVLGDPLWDFKCDVQRVLMRQWLVGSWSALLVNATRHPGMVRFVFTRRWEDVLNVYRAMAEVEYEVSTPSATSPELGDASAETSVAFDIDDDDAQLADDLSSAFNSVAPAIEVIFDDLDAADDDYQRRLVAAND